MPKIQRKTQKIFCNSADSDQLAVFGSMSTGTPVYSSDIEELQSNEAFDLGWDAATLEDKAPFMEEMNGVQYGLTYQIAYGLQEGIPEYDAATTYYIGSICKVLEDGKPVLYTSLTDNNIDNDPANDSINWERLSFGGGGLEIGDIGFTQMAIDETKGKRRKLNGQLIIQDQYQELTNIIKNSVALNPDLACTESEWQTEVTMNTFGLCGKFVIDDEGGTIRLPKYPNYFIAGLANIAPVVGNGMALGLTNGTTTGYWSAYRGSSPISQNVSISTTNNTIGAQISSGNVNNLATTAQQGTVIGVTTDPTKSGIEAQINEKQITGTYFIQVATGAETEDNITNELELINPYVLLEPKYFETKVYNLSWLRANGSFNGSSAVHPSVYNALLIELNADIAVGTTQNNYTKRGLSVKLSTDIYTDYDFVLNTADETFRLPIKVKLASSKAVAGNGYALGLTNGSVGGSWIAVNAGQAITATERYSDSYNVPLGTTWSSGDNNTFSNSYLGVTTDPTKSGLELSDSDLYLYFYVGAVADNAPIVNAGRIEEKVADLIPDNSSLISSYGMPSKKVSLTLGASGTNYTAPANGWFFLQNDAGGSNPLTLTNRTVGFYVSVPNGTSGHAPGIVIQVKKGDIVAATYNTPSGSTTKISFIYSEGDK